MGPENATIDLQLKLIMVADQHVIWRQRALEGMQSEYKSEYGAVLWGLGAIHWVDL